MISEVSLALSEAGSQQVVLGPTIQAFTAVVL